MTHDSALIIRVKVTEDSGIYYADSPDLLGLHICGHSYEQTCKTVIKAVKALFKHNRKMDVEVIPATNDVKNFPRITGECEQYVVQRA
jgi:hypothetical protein